LISRFLLPLLGGAVLFAQDPSANPQPPDLKALLNLSDSRIQGLVQLQRQKEQALRPVVQTASQLDKVLATEREIKRAHLMLLIRIKNNFTPAQQTQLRELVVKSKAR